MRLNGIDPEYNSLREAYYITALKKQDKVELKKTMALMSATAGGGEEAVEAFHKYLEEQFPEIAEERGKFIEDNKEILEGVAGEEIDLSNYKRID